MSLKLNIKLVTETSFEEMLEDLEGSVSFDIETSGLYPWAKKNLAALPKKWKKKPPDPRSYDARITSIGFGTASTQWIWLTDEFKVTAKRLARVKKKLDECFVIGQFAKFDILWMKVIYDVDWSIDFDTGIAHYLLDENSLHGLKDLAVRELGVEDWDVDLATKQAKGSRIKFIKYHAKDLLYTRELKKIFKKRLEEDPRINAVFKKILMPCVGVFVEMEYEGSYIDIDRMGEVEKVLRKKKALAEKKLDKWITKKIRRRLAAEGEVFNWGSPQQVGELLYDEIGIDCPEKTKKGANSTGESALKQIDHPLVHDLLDLRGANQQLSFFIDGWKPYLVGCRLHPSFKLTGTVTGRLSCEHPNWQQVPRDEFIRTLLIAPPGWVLIEADLSQIELRIAAELSGDRTLLEAFLTGKDPHWITALGELRRGHGEEERIMRTARKLLGRGVNDYDAAVDAMLEAGADACIAIDHAWKELRKKAKAVNFGFLFGMWWKKFKIYARDKYDVHLTDEQAQESRKGFFGTYIGLEGWHKRQKRYARRNGFVRSLSGRKRRLPAAMLEKECFEKGEAERQAVNSPVQGFANELNLMALIQLKKEFPSTIYRPIATVHDSILAYARIEHAEKIARRTLKVMRHPKLMDELGIEMQVPIDAAVKIGPWGAGADLEEWLDGLPKSRKK